MEFPTNPIPFSGMLPPPKVNQRTQSFSHTFRSDSDAPTERTIVLKVGSSSLTRENGAVNISTMSSLVELITNLRAKDYSVILVSSGAVSVGCQALKLKTRPKDLITKQAVAAVGQGSLVRLYHELFSVLGGQIAQVLLSRSNLSLEHHYLNSLNTFKELLRLNVIPIVNENDTLAVDELHFGDNDTLSALVASLVRAEWLFLLTDVDALYTSNPNKDPSAKAIHVVKSMKDLASLGVDVGDNSPMLPIHDVEKTSSNTSDHPDDAHANADADANANIPSSTPPPTQQSGQWGTGGMSTKLEAAKIATTAGVRTAICSTRNLDHIMMMLDGCTTVGTQFSPAQNVIVGRKKWIAQGLQPIGSIIIDAGACLALQKKTSLFAAGLVSIKGRFPANCCIRIVTQSGVEIGRGLSNYSSKELSIIKGVSSKDIAKKLNKALNNISERVDYPEAIIDRDNIALIYTEEFDSIVLGRDISSKDISSSSGEDGEKHCRMEAIMEKSTHDSQRGTARERGHISSNAIGISSIPTTSSPIPATCPINQIHKSSKLTNTVEEYADQAKDEFNYNVEKINMLSLQSTLPDSPQLHTNDSVAVTTPILTELGVLGHTHNYFANRVNSECTEYSKFSEKSERSDYQEACESHENSCAESHEEAVDSVESNGSNDGHDSNDSNDSHDSTDFSHPKPKTKTVINSKSPIEKNKPTKTIDITASKYGMY